MKIIINCMIYCLFSYNIFCYNEYDILPSEKIENFAKICETREKEKIISWIESVIINKNKKLANSHNKEGITPLIYAIQSNLEDIANDLMNLGVNINKQCNKKFTALHWAVLTQQQNLVLNLLNNKSDINIKNNNNQDALYIACLLQNIEILDILINQKNIYSKRIKEEIDIATNKNRVIIKQRLLTNENILFDSNYLYIAIKNNDIETTKYLLKNTKKRNLEDIFTDDIDSEGRFEFMQKNPNSLLYIDPNFNKKTFDYYKDIYSACIEWPKEDRLKIIGYRNFDNWVINILKIAIICDEINIISIIKNLNAININLVLNSLDNTSKEHLSNTPELLAILFSEENLSNNYNTKSANKN